MKKMLKKIIFPILAALFVFILVNNDAFLYHLPVGKIIAVRTISKEDVTDNFKNEDRQITQKLTVKLLNRNNERVTLENSVVQSQTTGQLYRKNEQIILQKTSGNWQIQTLKRDALILSLFTLFIGFLLSFIRLRASLLLLLSLLLNLIYFVIVIAFNVQFNPPVIALFALLSVIFAGSSLLFVLGRTRQMLFTFLTTVLTTAITFVVTFVVLHFTGNAGVHFEYLNYVTQNPSQFFFVGAMVSVLGAIMDGTGDIVAGLFGLYRQNQLNHFEMSYRNYVLSGISIGQEIIGTLTNVLFMIFMAEAFPMTLLLLRNGNTWGYIATVGLNLGLLQTVISAIGIVLAVPVTAFVTSLVLVNHHQEEVKS
ncbi:YibE/F family protein [Lactococcus nasutitermitis]|uniref:YibE/F family protein n=1 Tax=Lactococcus nasutitermitis TaxID=1652957 RepID=A0ABV9JEQ7_9LACT|nr:YibE/F family protein [Lactococcus nasutitermitis]